MEPNNDPRSRWGEDTSGENRGSMHAMIPGIILVGIGALFLLGNLHIVHIHDWIDYWPVILIGIGLAHLVDGDSHGRRTTGAVLLVVGGLFLADNLGYIWFNLWDLWPLILIGIGVMMLLNRTVWGPRIWRGGPFTARGTFRFGGSAPYGRNLINEFAIFGGSRRVVTNPDFQGGHINCIFGGVNLDLTGASMVGNSAILDISTVYGGVAVRVPAGWSVEVRGAGIFGGFSDQTVHPPSTPETKRLIVRGGAVFGGVTIKN
jgi:predicted membrane protein